MGASVKVRTCTLHLFFRVLAWIGWFKVDDCGISRGNFYPTWHVQVTLRHLSCARSFIAHKALYWWVHAPSLGIYLKLKGAVHMSTHCGKTDIHLVPSLLLDAIHPLKKIIFVTAGYFWNLTKSLYATPNTKGHDEIMHCDEIMTQHFWISNHATHPKIKRPTTKMNALCRQGRTVTNFVRCVWQQMLYAVLTKSVHYYWNAC